MRYKIKGFPNYEIDDKMQVYSIVRKVRFGNSSREVKEKKMTLCKNGRINLYNVCRYSFTPEQIWERRIENVDK